jgi:hypothetical protein
MDSQFTLPARSPPPPSKPRASRPALTFSGLHPRPAGRAATPAEAEEAAAGASVFKCMKHHRAVRGARRGAGPFQEG